MKEEEEVEKEETIRGRSRSSQAGYEAGPTASTIRIRPSTSSGEASSALRRRSEE